MKRLLAVPLLCLVLAGCNTTHSDPPSALPAVPADIQVCFRKALPDLHALNVGEVESLWKQDRVRYVVMRKCGVRFLAWYEDLRVNWK